MNKYLLVSILSLSLCVNSLYADALKNSLTDMLNEEETFSSMVNLDSLDLNAKPKSLQKVEETRSPDTVVATVNNHKIFKKEADAHLSKRTQGKMSNIDLLPQKQLMRVIQELSLPIMASDTANKELSAKEKEAIYVRTWIQKETLKIKVTDEEAKEMYDQLKEQVKANNSFKPIPSFESIKDQMKSQIIEKKIMTNLMQKADIKIN